MVVLIINAIKFLLNGMKIKYSIPQSNRYKNVEISQIKS